MVRLPLKLFAFTFLVFVLLLVARLTGPSRVELTSEKARGLVLGGSKKKSCLCGVGLEPELGRGRRAARAEGGEGVIGGYGVCLCQHLLGR